MRAEHEVEQLGASARAAAKAWGDSVDAYDRYLLEYPRCLHHQLVGRVIAALDGWGVRDGWVLDFGCGTGLLGQHLAAHGSRLGVLGIDIEAFVSRARMRAPDHADHRRVYIPLNGDWIVAAGDVLKRRRGRLVAITLNMVIFQLGPSERDVILRRLSALVTPGVMLILTSHAADFRFDDRLVDVDNPWKKHVYRLIGDELTRAGADEYAEAIRPRQMKDTEASVAQLLARHGFASLSDGRLDTIDVERTVDDRVAFTRIPVVERKVFGRRLLSSLWETLRCRMRVHHPNYSDRTLGVCIKAMAVELDPSIVIEVDRRVTGLSSPILAAASIVLRRSDGRVLLARRSIDRDEFPGVWSLPSTYGEHDRSLTEVLGAALAERLGIQVRGMRLVGRRLNARPSWRILMHLFEARFDGDAMPNPSKYDAVEWVDERAFLYERLRRIPVEEQGDCVRAWRSWFDRLPEGL